MHYGLMSQVYDDDKLDPLWIVMLTGLVVAEHVRSSPHFIPKGQQKSPQQTA